MAGDDVGPQVIRGYTTPRSRIAYATVKNVTRITVLTSIERFHDEVPRAAVRAEDFGGLTLFVPDGEDWPLRPTCDDRYGSVSAGDDGMARVPDRAGYRRVEHRVHRGTRLTRCYVNSGSMPRYRDPRRALGHR
jgi:hypothetical protein